MGGPRPALGHMWLGFVDVCTKRGEMGIAESEHALALDRNLAPAHASIGIGKSFIGRAEETEAHIVEALRLSPRDMFAFTWMHVAGAAKNQLSSWEAAVAWFRRSIQANRSYPYPHFALGAALAQLGRLDEARSAVKAGVALNPSFTLSSARALWTALSDDPTYLAQVEPTLDGLRKAGCRRNEPSLKAACGSGCDARRFSTDRAIRARGALRKRQTTGAMRTERYHVAASPRTASGAQTLAGRNALERRQRNRATRSGAVERRSDAGRLLCRQLWITVKDFVQSAQ